MNELNVQTIRNDTSMFGMKAVDASGSEGPVNAPPLMKELNSRCNGEHGSHVPLLNGTAAGAAVYPPGLVAAIIRG
eukprot:5800712-Heterocapsa_arctica.AAC.1